MKDVHPEQSKVLLACYCFMTGFIDAISFKAIYVWCGFQTGNAVQLALAIARPFQGDHTFYTPDRQALTSLLTFIFGALLARTGDRVGAKTRAWFFAGTFVQALFTMAAAICIWKSGQGGVASDRGSPAWTTPLTYAALGFMSASLGLQGGMAKRLNTQFAATLVITTMWCELMADPKLHHIRKWVSSRDHKLATIGALLLGGFMGAISVEAMGPAGTLGLGTGLRGLIAIGWLFIPDEKKKKYPRPGFHSLHLRPEEMAALDKETIWSAKIT
ncbi:hypothetical protein OE88DRAFT_1712059 [Heliocybe sulcata]|uniref:DUF1275 domain protein n=1 Tax=Heliocybe sulcata TaxID=5364 RepID=A0A5C3N934_9AGAM|nr:hypothetical protein OE88DRAFT_1712059 [Heliocybe sulcata]